MKKIIFVIFSILLTACSSKSKVIEPEKKQITVKEKSQIVIYYAIEDINRKKSAEKFKALRVITRGDTASQAAFNGIVGGILCNPLSLLSCSWKDLGFSKEDLDGTFTNIDNISHSYAFPKYLMMLQQKLTLPNSKDYTKVPIYFIPNENYLVYDENSYKLVAGFNIYINYFNPEKSFQCKLEKSGIAYEKWVDKNYSLALDEGRKLIDKCFEKLDKDHFKTIQEELEMSQKGYL